MPAIAWSDARVFVKRTLGAPMAGCRYTAPELCYSQKGIATLTLFLDQYSISVKVSIEIPSLCNIVGTQCTGLDATPYVSPDS